MKDKIFEILYELCFEPVKNKTFSNSECVRYKMMVSAMEEETTLNDILSYFYYQLGIHRLKLLGRFELRPLKDNTICIEYIVKQKDLEEDYNTLKLLLEV